MFLPKKDTPVCPGQGTRVEACSLRLSEPELRSCEVSAPGGGVHHRVVGDLRLCSAHEMGLPSIC